MIHLLKQHRSLFPLLLVLAAGCGTENYMGPVPGFYNLPGPDAMPGTPDTIPPVLPPACPTASTCYVLQSINGNPLPFLVIDVPTLLLSAEITVGHAQVNEDGTCSVSLTLRSNAAGVVTTETENDACTWTANRSR